jgi:hypothetical protein
MVKKRTIMAKNLNWQDDYWLLVMQLYLRKPVGVKPMYSRDSVFLSLELHIAPEQLFARQCEIAHLETPRIERMWNEYSRNPKRLTRAVELLRRMIGFNSSGDFYDGVDVEETFERDFRPLEGEEKLMPVSLVLILDLYFHLTPPTMVKETPEVQDLARMMKVPVELIVDVLDLFQHCDPYLHRKDVIIHPLLQPCQQIWEQYGNMDTRKLASYAVQLKAYYK